MRSIEPKGYFRMSVKFVRVNVDNGTYYVFSDEDGREIYDTQIIRTAEQGVHLLAHMAHKTWLDREQFGRLAEVVCTDLGCWK